MQSNRKYHILDFHGRVIRIVRFTDSQWCTGLKVHDEMIKKQIQIFFCIAIGVNHFILHWCYICIFDIYDHWQCIILCIALASVMEIHIPRWIVSFSTSHSVYISEQVASHLLAIVFTVTGLMFAFGYVFPSPFCWGILFIYYTLLLNQHQFLNQCTEPLEQWRDKDLDPVPNSEISLPTQGFKPATF